MTSTKAGGTMTHDMSNYGLHPYANKKKSTKSIDLSINNLAYHSKSLIDF